MRKIIPTISFLCVGLVVFPFLVFAHGGGADNTSTRADSNHMMQDIEHRVLSDEEHERMENLMIQMMNGTLTEQEEQELVELMQDHPGPFGMMMNRFDDDRGRWIGGHSMWSAMGGGMLFSNGWWSWMIGLSILATLVWIGVGVALIVFIVRRSRNNK